MRFAQCCFAIRRKCKPCSHFEEVGLTAAADLLAVAWRRQNLDTLSPEARRKLAGALRAAFERKGAQAP